MAEYLAPGVYVEEVSSGLRVIEGAGTSTCGFVGVAARGPMNDATLVTNLSQFYTTFGRPLDIRDKYYLGYAVECFFREGGTRCYVVRVAHPAADSTAHDEKVPETAQWSSGALTVKASSPGSWGRNLQVSIQNSSKLETTLAEQLTSGTEYDQILVEKSDGIVPGMVLWLVQPILAPVTYDADDNLLLELQDLDEDENVVELGFPRDPSGKVVAGNTIATGSQVMTPDFRFMTTLSEDVGPLDAENPEPALAAAPIVDGGPLNEGELLWIVETARQQLVTVQRVDEKTLTLVDPFTPSETFPAGTLVLARDFILRVRNGNEGPAGETFENLSIDERNQVDFAEHRVNARSSWVHVEVAAVGTALENTAFTPLTGGTTTNPDALNDLSSADYVGHPGNSTGLYAFDGVDDVSTLAVPFPRFNSSTGQPTDDDAALKTVADALTAYCENRKYLFAVLDSKPGSTPKEALEFREGLNASDHAAYYYPWIQVVPAGESQPFAVPPSGAVAGIYAYTDRQRGVHKAPAGTLVGRVKSAAGVERLISKAEQDGLNKEGVNVIRNFADSGLNVWGARTISANAEWRYVNVRRLLSFIEKSIDDGTQWTVFEPNNLALWKKIERNVTAFLRGVWRSGALFGDTEDMAFRVRCDAELNTPETIELGQVITEIKVAPAPTAEFVIFRITQAAAGSNLSE